MSSGGAGVTAGCCSGFGGASIGFVVCCETLTAGGVGFCAMAGFTGVDVDVLEASTPGFFAPLAEEDS